MLSTPEQLLSNTGTAAHIDRAVCSVVPEYTVVLRTLMRLFVVLFPGKRFLQFPEALFVYFDKSRVRDREFFLFRAVMAEVLQPHIHPDDVTGVKVCYRLNLVNHSLKAERSNISFSFPPDSHFQDMRKLRNQPLVKCVVYVFPCGFDFDACFGKRALFSKKFLYASFTLLTASSSANLSTSMSHGFCSFNTLRTFFL